MHDRHNNKRSPLLLKSSVKLFQIKQNDGLPQQVCLRCLGKLDFTCDFVADCHDVQRNLWCKEAMFQRRNDVDTADEIEIEDNKENIVPTLNISPLGNLRIVKTRSLRRHRGKNIRGSAIPSCQRMNVTIDTLNQEASSDTKAAADYLLRDSSVIVKQENIDSGWTNIQGHSPVVTPRTNDNQSAMVWIPIEMSWSGVFNARRESKTSCVNSPLHGDQAGSSGSNPTDESSSTVLNDVDCAKSSRDDASGDTKTAIASLVQNNEPAISEVLEASGRKAQPNAKNNATGSASSTSRINHFGRISQLINEDQKNVIETNYKVDMTLVDDEELERNLTLLNQKNIKCNICAANYSRMDKCKIHIMGHLKMKPYKCMMCDFATVTPTNIRTHIRKTHLKIKPYACDQCEKRFANVVLLQEHLNTHTGARPFKCQNCNFTCASRQVLSSHNTTHKQNKDICCKICDKMFYSGARMRAHMHIHNKNKGLTCNICKARLSNETTLEMHIKNLHSREYICNICGKKLTCRKAWHNHQNVHAEAKYQCTICPNVYKSKHILKEHLLKHKGIRKYKCTVCEKSFGQQSHLAAHAVTHSKARFACPGCERLFNRHDNMKIHTKRCRLFLEKPELATVFTSRVHSKSTNKPTKNDVT